MDTKELLITAEKKEDFHNCLLKLEDIEGTISALINAMDSLVENNNNCSGDGESNPQMEGIPYLMRLARNEIEQLRINKNTLYNIYYNKP